MLSDLQLQAILESRAIEAARTDFVALRDHFAVAALGPLLAALSGYQNYIEYFQQALQATDNINWLAERAYAVADAMIAARDGGETK